MTEVSDHTFYAASARPVAARPALTREIEADVCVVGGGFAGLWAAHALAVRGKDVVLLEADTIANGASGRNGGFVSAGYAAELEKIIARVGLADARALYDLSRRGVESVRALISRDPAAMQMKPGRLHVSRQDDAAGMQAYGEMLARDFGHELEFWSKGKLRRTLSTTRYYQALHEKDAFHLNPLALARLLADEIEDRGGRIFESSRVIEADISGLRKSLATAEGRVRMFDLVLAGSAGIGEAFPWLAKTILPIRTHVVVTAPLGDEMRAIRFDGAISDMRRAGDYYHLAGERLLWGGRISARRNPPRQLAEVMAKDIASVYPQLHGVPIDHAWSGIMGYAVHWMPQIGMAQPGVWVASAFGGQGLNTTAMAGDLIASAIAEHDDRWRLFIPFGLVWNGGWAGRTVAQSIYWGMQGKDRFEEARTRAAERDKAAIRAGHAPGYPAYIGRRIRHRFVRSRFGKAAIAMFGALQRAAKVAAQPFILLGRALTQLILWIAQAIGFAAKLVGGGMEWVAKAIASLWRNAVVPAARRGWTNVIVPVSRRFGASARHIFNREKSVPVVEAAVEAGQAAPAAAIAEAEAQPPAKTVKGKKKKPKDKDEKIEA
jgi:gamma-glutamylputrescine oxidase